MVVLLHPVDHSQTTSRSLRFVKVTTMAVTLVVTSVATTAVTSAVTTATTVAQMLLPPRMHPLSELHVSRQ